MATRTRISPQQLRLIELAAANPFGFDNDQAYMAVLGVPAKWYRKERLPDVGKTSVHRSLSKLVRGGFLRRSILARSHDGRRWSMTIAGKRIADQNGYTIAIPDPETCTTPEVTARIATWKEIAL